MNVRKELAALLLALCLALPLARPAHAEATVTHQQLENLLLSVDGNDPRPVRTTHYSCVYNR